MKVRKAVEKETYTYDIKPIHPRIFYKKCSCGCGNEYKNCDMWVLTRMTMHENVMEKLYYEKSKFPTKEDLVKYLDSTLAYPNSYKTKLIKKKYKIWKE